MFSVCLCKIIFILYFIVIYRQSNYKDALHYFEESLRRSKSDLVHTNSRTETHYFSSLSVTASYNLARLHEASCNFGEAEKLYKDILKEHPNYVDCECNICFS